MLFLTADIHFDCENLRKHTRAEFSTVEDHNEAMLEGINSTVGRHDQLVIVGDFVLKRPGRWRPKIKCRQIFFVLGNHDNERKTRAVFGANVWQQRMVKGSPRPRQLIWCSHYPTAYWDRSHYATYHAYGHIHHNLEYEAAMDLAFPERRSMDVGVDAAKAILGSYRPFHEDEFFDLLSGRQGHNHISRK
jgi:calcineurin-like phosphoesterase family protein